MTRVLVLTVITVMLSAGSARAQGWELGATAGFAPGVDLDRAAPEVDTLTLDGAPTWTFQAA